MEIKRPFIVFRKDKLSDLKNIFLPPETQCFLIDSQEPKISRLGMMYLKMFDAQSEFDQSGIVMIAPVKNGCVVLKGADMIQDFLDMFVFGGKTLTGYD